jgi:hypothetical protein
MVVFCLVAGTTAFCQSVPPAGANTENLVNTSPTIFQFQKEIAKAPERQFTASAPLNIGLRPDVGVLQGNAQIDPKIIVHPPPSSIGAQPPGTQMAQNLYPGLQWLPIGESHVKERPIPTQWPKSALEAIPTEWHKFKISPAQDDAAAKPQPPAK